MKYLYRFKLYLKTLYWSLLLKLNKHNDNYLQIVSILFDEVYYLKQNPELANKKNNLLVHYFSTGAYGGKNPHLLFDSNYYLQQNPQLANWRINPLVHYLTTGAYEGKNPHPLFNSKYYLQQNPQLVSHNINPLIHFIDIGINNNLQQDISADTNIDINLLLSYKIGLDYNIISEEVWIDKLNKMKQYIKEINYIVRKIENIYQTYLFKNATPVNILNHLVYFYNKYQDIKVRNNIITSQNIIKYLDIKPFKLKLDTVNQCNLRCTMCHFSNPEVSAKKKVEINSQTFAKIAEEIFPLCSQIFLSFSTEPLMNSKFEEILTITENYQIPFVNITTNGLLLHEKMINLIVNSQISHLYISIDGATKKTYENIRIGAKFERLIDRIKLLNKVKAKNKSLTPFVAFNFTMMYSNIMDLPKLIHLAHELEVETVSATHLVPLAISNIEYEKESLLFHQDLSNEILDKSRKLAKQYQIKINFPENFQTHSKKLDIKQSLGIHRSLQSLPIQNNEFKKSFCAFPWHFIGIDYLGNIVPCGWWYNEETMGNLLEDSFATIWNNNKYSQLRLEHLNGDLRSICKICPTMGMGNVNNSDSFVKR